MLIKEKNWDLALKSAFKKNIFSVTGRSIHGFILMNNLVISDHVFGREYPLGNTHLVGRAIAKMFKTFNLFFIYKFWKPVSYGLCANRGPLMLDYSIFKKIGFFDEKFAPFELDDLDLSCRVFKKFGLISASKPTFYQEINGSKKSNSNSAKMSQKAYIKNSKIIKKRHSSLAII
jgi:GT2 family glycosyltransferase